MSEPISAAPASTNPSPRYPEGFRARRGLNWTVVGFLYTTFYMCRYNLPIANKAISDELGFSKGDMGWIISTNMWAYAVGQIVNGLLADKLGGKRTMLIGAAGTVVMNLLFGVASFWGLLGFFIAIRGIDGYLQSFGSPGFIKINVSWFNKRERGQFAGIYGFMINLGRFIINQIGPALMAGSAVFGMIHMPQVHWRWLFWVPSIVAAIVALTLYFTVKDTPEQAGYHVDDLKEAEPEREPASARAPAPEREPGILDVLVKIGTNPVIWVVGMAYSCTGTVRHSLDHWYIRYFQEWHGVQINDWVIVWLGFLIPFMASAGSLTAGIVSDKLFKGSRAPVAAGIYFIETVIILFAAQFAGLGKEIAVIFVVLMAFTVNSTHSIMGVAAAMDIGGKKMAGFAAGLINSFQYLGGALAGVVLGKLLDGTGVPFRVFQWLGKLLTGTTPDQHMGWGIYFYFMAPFGALGCLLVFLASRIARRRGVSL